MQEHPVPQNVTGYEFHLIGQMTLKQFMEVAAGVIAAVLIYWTNLPQIFKYPLMAIVGLMGVAAAFIPLEGRPLDRWFFAFVKSIYQPTMFFWKKTNLTPGVFTYAPPKDMDTSPKIDYTPIRQSRLQEYVHTVNSEPVEKDEEAKAADELLKLFNETIQAPTKAKTTSPTQVGHITEMTITPTIAETPVKVEEKKPTILPEATGQIAPTASIPAQDKVGITSDLMAQKQQAVTPAITDTLHTVVSHQIFQQSDVIKPVIVLNGFPFPNKPTNPNMLAGMVVTNDDKIVEGAIITITRQSDNNPVRAMKTNTLGQFAVVTPLESGAYSILTEKDGLRFDKYSLVLNNQVVEPILIKSL